MVIYHVGGSRSQVSIVTAREVVPPVHERGGVYEALFRALTLARVLHPPPSLVHLMRLSVLILPPSLIRSSFLVRLGLEC